jgi:hypothetical protein
MSKKWVISEPIQLPPSFCPRCFSLLDAATNVTGKDAPEVGDFTVCIACSALLCFTAGMALRMASLSEIPLQIRAQFAQVMYLAGEVRNERKR